jgi:hypothetical protein
VVLVERSAGSAKQSRAAVEVASTAAVRWGIELSLQRLPF